VGAVAVSFAGLGACATPDATGVTVGSAGPTTTAGIEVVPATNKPSDSSTSTTAASTGTTLSATNATPSSDGGPIPPDPEQLEFAKCGSKQECATLVVPLDYANPANGDTITLNVKRRSAGNGAIGPLLVNPGGPGAPGSTMVDNASGYFSQRLLAKFDIIAWDPRGTGQSTPVECTDNIDDLYGLDGSPDTPEEVAALKKADDDFTAGCVARSGRILPFVATRDSARDMDMIRRALGEDKISYLGFSYGSELGATYATLFPTRVRAMTIDGAVDPDDDYAEGAMSQGVGFENALNGFLADCAKNTRCPFNNSGDPGKAFDELMVKLDESPIVIKTKPGRPAVNQGVAVLGVASALYYSALWPDLAKALAGAQRGDGTGLLRLYDDYTEHDNPDAKHFFDSFIVISCADDPGPATVEELRTLNAELARLLPHLGKLSQSEELTCRKMIKNPRPAVKITGKGAGPILVVGTTGDPATPFDGTKNMAAALEGGVLLTVDANQHTGYGANSCAMETVDRSLIDLKMPEPGKVCS
jgi:pimeloyl-ACP methyl ester carboxylesterase